MDPRTHPRGTVAMQQQGVGGDQQNLEEDEQVEQVRGKEGTIDAHQLELEQRMEVGASCIVAAAGIEHRACRQHGCDQQHQRAQPVEHQDDAEWRLPIAQGIDAQLVIAGEQQQPDSDRYQHKGRQQRQDALGRFFQTVQHQEQAAHEQRQQNRQDQCMRHSRVSRPST